MNRKSRAGWLLLAAAAAWIDLWTKGLWQYPDVGKPRILRRTLVDGWLYMSAVMNKGGVWSLNIAESLLLFATILAVPLVTAWIFWPRRTSRLECAAKSLVLGGAIGNLWDRWQYGAVRDFIDVSFGDVDGWHWPTFNVADVALVVGIALLLVTGFVNERREKREKRDESEKAKGEAGA